MNIMMKMGIIIMMIRISEKQDIGAVIDTNGQ
jgi:hypothetical protein